MSEVLTINVLAFGAADHRALPVNWAAPANASVTVSHSRAVTGQTGAVTGLTAPPSGVFKCVCWAVLHTGAV